MDAFCGKTEVCVANSCRVTVTTGEELRRPGTASLFTIKPPLFLYST